MNDLKNMRCPKCGKSYYAEGMSTSTCVYYQPIYKDGVNINPDRNIHTTEYYCLECGCHWKQQSNGETTITL